MFGAIARIAFDVRDVACGAVWFAVPVEQQCFAVVEAGGVACAVSEVFRHGVFHLQFVPIARDWAWSLHSPNHSPNQVLFVIQSRHRAMRLRALFSVD